MLLALVPAMASAQLAVGGWTMHSSFSGVDDIIETGVYVYYKSGASLFRIDKETMEVTAMNVSNYLNDSDVTGIFESDDFKSIVVAYESGNMDRLYDNGTILNLSDIKDASITGSRKINDIAFGKDNFYVAADFGLVTYDKKKNEVRESMFTDLTVDHVVAMGDIVGIHYNQQMRFARQSERITSLDKISLMQNYANTTRWNSMKGFGENKILMTFNNRVYMLTVDIDAGKASLANVNYGGSQISNPNPAVKRMADGAYVSTDAGIHKLNDSGEQEFIEMPREKALTEPLLCNGKLSSVWIGSEDGIREMNYTTPSSPAVVHDAIKGTDLTVSQIHDMHIGRSGKIYLYNLGEHLTFGLPNSVRNKSKVNVMYDGQIKDISGKDVTIQNTGRGTSKTPPYFINYNYRLCEDPSEDEAYYIGTFFEGFYRVKNGKDINKYYSDNMNIFDNGGYACIGLVPLVDRTGNLWVYSAGKDNDESSPRFSALDANKRLSDNVTKSDWKQFTVKNHVKDFRDAFGLVCNNSDNVLFFLGRYSKGIVKFDTKGTQSLNDDSYTLLNSYIDQDNKEVEFNHITSAVEDNNGRLWVGTDNGVFEIADLNKATSSIVNVNHLKVPRNDGTNLADYLLSSQIVSCIAVDNSNRKWISTIGSGVYLVSENGDEILEHYTSDNSMLPNIVYSVACDPNSNKVYFGTAVGLYEYSSTSSPGKDDYSDVYAYPNPVRPDYTGWITVTGLMENSLVKIADAAGNVFHQGRSDGGMFTWDGCNAAGERVKTGVYFVYASQNATGSNEACVTKIMVIN